MTDLLPGGDPGRTVSAVIESGLVPQLAASTLHSMDRDPARFMCLISKELAMSVDLGASDEVHTSPERTNPSTFYPRGI